eukprot:268396_1
MVTYVVNADAHSKTNILIIVNSVNMIFVMIAIGCLMKNTTYHQIRDHSNHIKTVLATRQMPISETKKANRLSQSIQQSTTITDLRNYPVELHQNQPKQYVFHRTKNKNKIFSYSNSVQHIGNHIEDESDHIGNDNEYVSDLAAYQSAVYGNETLKLRELKQQTYKGSIIDNRETKMKP